MFGDATQAEKNALAALLAAHNPNKLPIRRKAIKDILETLTAAESTQLVNALNTKQLWALITRGEDVVREDAGKIAQMCTILGITPANLFSR